MQQNEVKCTSEAILAGKHVGTAAFLAINSTNAMTIHQQRPALISSDINIRTEPEYI